MSRPCACWANAVLLELVDQGGLELRELPASASLVHHHCQEAVHFLRGGFAVVQAGLKLVIITPSHSANTEDIGVCNHIQGS